LKKNLSSPLLGNGTDKLILQLSLAISSWVGIMTNSQTTVTPCGWRVKADMVHVWVAGKTVMIPLLQTGHIWELQS